jgi:hypothetical protein
VQPTCLTVIIAGEPQPHRTEEGEELRLLGCSDVSEKLNASFIRVITIGELGTTLAVTNNRRTLRRNSKENLVAPEIEPGTSELAARDSDHKTTEVVFKMSIYTLYS